MTAAIRRRNPQRAMANIGLLLVWLVVRQVWRVVRPFAGPHLGRLRQHRPRALRVKTRAAPVLEHYPRISLVTPSFNHGRFLERTLRSVLSQNYPNLEYVVQDGGSSDDSLQIVRRHADRLSHWQSTVDGGQAQALNLGFARTGGEIMGWLNSDDILLPGSLATVAEHFVAHPEVDVVYGHRLLIDEDDREIGRWVMPEHCDRVLGWVDFVPQETLFWRRSLWERCGARIDESFRFAMDWELLLRFREAGAVMCRLPYFLGAFRVHTLQKTQTEIDSGGQAEMMRLRRRAHGREVGYQEIWFGAVPYLFRHMQEHWKLAMRSGRDTYETYRP
ncbi:MAG: glycosyltransferase family 2 protein [Burkholderiales bacterium]